MSELIKIPGGTFEEETHTYRDEQGNKIISVTQILSDLGFVNYDYISKDVLERKSQYGIAVHSAIQFLVEGSLDWSTVSDECMDAVIGLEAWLKEVGFISEEQEQRGICTVNGMKFGYTFDHRGTMPYKGKTRRAILDLKTCVNASPSWAIQTAGYEIASPSLDGEKYLRVVAQADKKGKVTPHFYEDKEDRNCFLYSLYVCTWKMNHAIN